MAPKNSSSRTRSTANPAQLVPWLELHPDYAHLVAKAQDPDRQPSLKERVQAISYEVSDWLLTTPSSLHGTAYVTPKVKGDAKITSRVANGSNLTDFFTNWPLFFYTARDLGNPWAFLVSLGISLCLLKAGNDLAIGVTRNKAGNRAWSQSATLWMIALNIVQSLASGVGVELLNNQPVLSVLRAEELIADQIQRVEVLQEIDNPRYDAIKQSCAEGEAVLNSLDYTDPTWDAQYVKLYGRWEERLQDWREIPLENLPQCRQLERIEQEAFQAYETAKQILEEKLIRRSEMGNDLLFLRQAFPDLYDHTFDADGNIRSGVDAVRLATQNFFGQLSQGQFINIGFSLFSFSLSVITSAASCLMTIAYARRADVQMSWNDAIRQERDRWLDEQWQAIVQQPAIIHPPLLHPAAAPDADAQTGPVTEN